MRNAEASALGELAPVAEGLSLGIEFPLVVDLDGTLIATDALHESLLFFLKRQGIASWKIPFWILSGRAKVKNRLAAVVTEEEIATFPVNDELLAMAEREAKRGAGSSWRPPPTFPSPRRFNAAFPAYFCGSRGYGRSVAAANCVTIPWPSR